MRGDRAHPRRWLLTVVQGKRASLRSSTIMIRQPLQRLVGMQASDIDIYRRVTREKTATMVRPRAGFTGQYK